MLIKFLNDSDLAFALSVFFTAVCFAVYILIGRKRGIRTVILSSLAGVTALFVLSYAQSFISEYLGFSEKYSLCVNFYTVILSVSLGIPGAVIGIIASVI